MSTLSVRATELGQPSASAPSTSRPGLPSSHWVSTGSPHRFGGIASVFLVLGLLCGPGCLWPEVPTEDESPGPEGRERSLAASEGPPASEVPSSVGETGAETGRAPVSATHSANRRIPDYRGAKEALRKVYQGRPRTLYCDCPYDPRRMQADRRECGYVSGTRVNWEHVVPASHLGNHRPSWSGDDPRCRNHRPRSIRGRDCARKIDPDFNLREADLYNLYPSLMDLNQARGSYRPGEVRGELRRFGRCDFEVEGRRVEPAPTVRGDFARTYFYMAEAYPDADFLRASLKRTLTEWARADPVDAGECARAARIEQVQGNVNRFVAEPCRARGLYDPTKTQR